MDADATDIPTSPDVSATDHQLVESDAQERAAGSQDRHSAGSDDVSNASYDEAGLVALHEIIQNASQNCANEVDILLSSTIVDVNAIASSGGCTALHLAAQLRDEFVAQEVALQLLRYGADPGIKDMSLRTAADYAYSQDYGYLGNYLSFRETSIDEAITAIQSRREEHFSISLLKAAKTAVVEDVRRCLELGANPNTLNQHGVGPIHFVVARCPADRRSTIVELLVNGGADVNLRDHEGDTALNLLIKCGKNDPDGTLTTLAKYLLDKGTNKEIQDLDGKDATMLATERQFDDIVSLLPMVQRGKENTKKTVTFTTDDVTHPETNEAEDAIIAVVATTNETQGAVVKESTLHLLHAAIKSGSLSEVKRHLAENKDDINTPDKDGNPPIHLAILRDSDEDRTLIIEELLRNGANLNAQRQSDGNTALHLAVERNDKMAVQMLLEAKPDINITSQLGETPHNAAVRLSHTEVAQMIQKYRVGKNTDKWRKKARFCLIL